MAASQEMMHVGVQVVYYHIVSLTMLKIQPSRSIYHQILSSPISHLQILSSSSSTTPFNRIVKFLRATTSGLITPLLCIVIYLRTTRQDFAKGAHPLDPLGIGSHRSNDNGVLRREFAICYECAFRGKSVSSSGPIGMIHWLALHNCPRRVKGKSGSRRWMADEVHPNRKAQASQIREVAGGAFAVSARGEGKFKRRKERREIGFEFG